MAETFDDDEMPSPEACFTAEVTYRQLDYWARVGYVRPGNSGKGSGSHRHWPVAEVEAARLAGLLIKAGLNPRAAFKAVRARRSDGDHGLVMPLGDGLNIVFDEDLTTPH